MSWLGFGGAVTFVQDASEAGRGLHCVQCSFIVSWQEAALHATQHHCTAQPTLVVPLALVAISALIVDPMKC
jgi:hypothetical protein